MGSGQKGLSLTEWHQRYRQQGEWSKLIQHYLFNQAQLGFDDKILEVGSGTGAILELLSESGYTFLTGVDIDYHSLVFSRQNRFPHLLVQADGYQLPFQTRTFDACLCHYLLLWLEHPINMLSEIRRVTKAGGWVMALAEPDHQSRIDYPPPLDRLGRIQTQALQDQGVDIQMGRKLRSLFQEVGLLKIQSGILSAQWSSENIGDPTEWFMLEGDLAGVLDEGELSNYMQLNHEAWIEGERVLFVPTFYAMGKVPN